MLTSELLELLPQSHLIGRKDREIRGIAHDSRAVRDGFLFAALRGAHTDGHRYLDQAVAAGAAVLLVEEPPAEELLREASAVVVPDTRAALAPAAAGFYGNPTRELLLFAVTGTNGKTSTTHLIDCALSAAGVHSGVAGTLGAKIGARWRKLPHTTPESADLQQLFREMAAQGVSAAAMEASSHAIAQNRMDCVEVDVAVFTNLTQDHLDFHGTMDGYFEVKSRLFTSFADGRPGFTSVINIDDPWGRERLLPIARGRVVTYGTSPDALYRAAGTRSGPRGASFVLDCPEGSARVSLSLGGLFNIHNALAAAAAALSQGFPLEAVIRGLESLRSVPGRFELVDAGQDYTVIVDYAHTPDGLENVLSSCRRLDAGRVIAVFGCGGDRDRLKRPQMGEIAYRLSDVCVVTSDNPRSEDPAAIIRDVLAGMPEDRSGKVRVHLDRREAIREAISEARAGDVVIIAGKGHETDQIFADRCIEFDDRAVVREIISGGGTEAAR